jgi:hypothetical protein
MPLVVLSADANIRQALCAIAAEEGLEPIAAGTIHEAATALTTHGSTVVLVEAIRDRALADAFLPIAEWAELRVGLICGDSTAALAHHACVRHVLSAPFTTSALRVFISDIARGHRASHTSQTRLRAAPARARAGRATG